MADNKTNLVDLTLLNTAYKINKRRIDLLSEKVKTKNLEVVGTATTNGTLTVNSGDFSADTLAVTGGMTINGGGVTLPSGTALTLSKGGSVTKSATFDSLTGSVKFGNAISNGNVTGSAQIVVPTGKSLSLSGSAVTNGNTTIEGTITASNKPSVSGSLSATNTKVIGDTTIEGIITASNKPSVSGSLHATDTEVTSDTTIEGIITASNKPSVSGSLSATSTNVTSNTTIEGTITASDKPSVSGSLSATLANVTSATTIEGIVKASEDNAPVVTGTINATNTKTTDATTITGTIESASIKASGTATLSGSTIQSATIKNGTIDLNSNNLSVTSASTITTITEGDTTTITGVGAIDAKSMTLQNTPLNSSSLVIENTYGSKDITNNRNVALYCTGGITGAKVYNAVWNDLADAIEVPFDTELEYGYCYKYKEGKVYKTDSYADANVMGIHSDTAGMVLGTKDKGVVCINLAVAGVVLAYVDKEYECGTALVATKEGKLTKANRRTRLFHPERIVATFYKKEIQDFWGSSTHKVAVNGRSWVKVK